MFLELWKARYDFSNNPIASNFAFLSTLIKWNDFAPQNSFRLIKPCVGRFSLSELKSGCFSVRLAIVKNPIKNQQITTWVSLMLKNDIGKRSWPAHALVSRHRDNRWLFKKHSSIDRSLATVPKEKRLHRWNGNRKRWPLTPYTPTGRLYGRHLQIRFALSKLGSPSLHAGSE